MLKIYFNYNIFIFDILDALDTSNLILQNNI